LLEVSFLEKLDKLKLLVEKLHEERVSALRESKCLEGGERKKGS